MANETALSLSGNEKATLEEIATKFILLAELFGTGKRDATGSTTQSSFVARRDGVVIDYSEESGEVYMSGHVRVSDAGTMILSAERDSNPDFEAGKYGLGYKIVIYSPREATLALNTFVRATKLIGKKGMRLPVNLWQF